MVFAMNKSWFFQSGKISFAVLIFLCVSLPLKSQDTSSVSRKKVPTDNNLAEKLVEKPADTLMHFTFPPIEIEGEYTHLDKSQEHKYHQLYEDLKRTYPLSFIVSSELRQVNGKLDSVYTTRAAAKKFMKQYEKQIYNTYIDTLKSLNIRQVRLFVKLISRETGSTPFDLIKKYRSGLDALFWQLTANALTVNLKNEYDPEEDHMIDDILNKFY